MFGRNGNRPVVRRIDGAVPDGLPGDGGTNFAGVALRYSTTDAGNPRNPVGAVVDRPPRDGWKPERRNFGSAGFRKVGNIGCRRDFETNPPAGDADWSCENLFHPVPEDDLVDVLADDPVDVLAGDARRGVETTRRGP